MDITYTSTGSVKSPNSTPLSGTIRLAAGESFPDISSAIGFNVLHDVGSTSTATTGVSGSVTITKIEVVQDVDLVLHPSTRGGYTYKIGDAAAVAVNANGTAATPDVTMGASVTLTATGADNYDFYGWMQDGKLLSSNATYTMTVNASMNVYPVYLTKGTAATAPFSVNGTSYMFWHQALEQAKATGKTVVVAENYTLRPALEDNGLNSCVTASVYNQFYNGSGTFTVPSGVTLLVPFDSAYTMYTNCDAYYGETMTTPTAFRTLTMASGTKIVVNGTMNVAGRFAYTNSGGQSGSPTGPLGFVDMASGSNITVNSGGNLYAYGYIIGDGTVTANSGANVYEILQMPEFRGGDQSTGMDHEVFPLSQFYVQNIEVPMTLYTGATESTYGKVYASKLYFDTGITLFGSGGMFQLSSGYVTKWFDGTQDRLHIEINGVATMNSVKLVLNGLGLPISVDSAEYVLPINGGFTIHLKSGSSLTVPSTQEVLLQPNAQVIIEQNASVTVNSKLYIYDAAQWGAFSNWGHAGAGDANCWDTPVIPVSYSPTRTKVRLHVFPRGLFTDSAGNAVYMTEDPDIYEAIFGKNAGDLIAEADLAEFLTLLPDASILVNGTLTGNIYTTADGANIYSSGTGTFTQTATENASVYQLMMGSDYSFNSENAEYYVEASATPAQLKNSDGSYISSTATTFNYDSASGKWLCATHTGVDTDHTCDVCGFTTECVDEVPEGETYADHKCDICGETISECTDENKDSICDICGTNLCAHGTTEVQNKADATCTKDGYTGDKVCTSCGATVETGTTIESAGHSYTSEVTQAATCAAKGVTTYTCSVCGDSYTEAIDKIPHSYDTGTVTTSPTCSATGTMTYECINCDHSYTSDIAATGHTPGEAATCTEAQTCTVCSTVIEAALGHSVVTDAAVAPTCTATGLSAGSHCDRCGEVLAAQTVVTATGHSYEAVVTQPTCTEEGFTTYTCSCGDTYTADEVAAVGHNYTSTVTAPTCTEQGYTTYTCACGVSYEGDYVDATGHSYEAVVTQPTCTAQGYTTYTCSCGHTYNDSYVAATSHSWNNGDVTTTPGCESEGVKTYTCTECGGTKTETIAATGHSWNEGEITTAPGCESKGVKTLTCSKCGDTKTEAVSETGHTSEDVEYKAPTCTELGHEAGQKCSICNAVLSGMAEIAATGHNHEAKVTAPTCTEDGYTTYTCVCGDSYTGDPIAATGHSYTSKVTDPTCIEEGYTTYTCSNCSDTYKADTVAATGHSYESVVTAPSCEAQGYTTYTCHCGDSRVDTYVDPIGHGYTNYNSDGNASCTEDGTKTAVCENGCGKSDTITDTGSATGHTFTNKASAMVAAEATCTEPAHYYTACDVCGTASTQETVEVDDPLGHDYENYEAEAPSCTEIGWNAYQTCNNCDYTSYVEITALGHTAGDVVVENEVAADCTNDGSHDNVTYCTLCGVETSRETIEVPATGHTAGDVVVENEVAADCVNDGSYDNVTYCTVCDAELRRETVTVDALGHTDGEIVVDNNVDPSCTTDGSYDNVTYCTVCGEETSRETVTVDALGHSYEAVVTAPTCTAKGYTTYTCACGDSYTEEIAALGHNEQVVPGSAATCTEAGMTDGSVCSTCGETITEQEEIPATGHNFVDGVCVCGEKEACEHTGGEATCQNKAVCELCGEEYGELGEHTPGEETQESYVASTPTSIGSYIAVVSCSECGEELSRETKAALLNPFTSTNMELQNSLSMGFVLRLDTLTGNDNYAVISRLNDDGWCVVAEVPQSEWSTYTNGRHKIDYPDINAKEMTVHFEVVIYNSQGEAISVAYEDSVCAYATRAINTLIARGASAEQIRVFVDMLNYGAAVQNKLDFKKDDLANANLTEAQKAYASTTVNATNEQVTGPYYSSSAVSAESRVELGFLFYQANVTKDMYAIVTYTHHNGEVYQNTVYGSEFETYSNARWRIPVEDLSTVDGGQLVTCTIYDANGNEVSCAKDSVNSYLVRAYEKTNGEVYLMTLRFTMSAYAFFH